jgi:hypothetical protein
VDEDEAKFLIDQFNKYASWAVRRGEFEFPFYAMLLATIVFWVTIQPGLLPKNVVWEVSSCITGFIIGLALAVYLKQQSRYPDFKERLILLDTYRRKSSLPNSLDLAQVIGTEEIPLRIIIDNLLAEEKGLPKPFNLQAPPGSSRNLTLIIVGIAFITLGVVFVMLTVLLPPPIEVVNYVLLASGLLLGVGGFILAWILWLKFKGKLQL